MAQVTISDVRRIPSPEMDRVGKEDLLITYRLDSSPAPRTIRIPAEGATDATIQARIKAEVAAVPNVMGKSFTI